MAGRNFSIVATIASSSCVCSVTKFAIIPNFCSAVALDPLAVDLSFAGGRSCSELGSAS